MIIKLIDIFPEKLEQLIISRNWNNFGLDRIQPFSKGIILEGEEQDIFDFIQDEFDCEEEDITSFFEIIESNDE